MTINSRKYTLQWQRAFRITVKKEQVQLAEIENRGMSKIDKAQPNRWSKQLKKLFAPASGVAAAAAIAGHFVDVREIGG